MDVITWDACSADTSSVGFASEGKKTIREDMDTSRSVIPKVTLLPKEEQALPIKLK